MAEGEVEDADMAEIEMNEEEMEDLDAKITEVKKKLTKNPDDAQLSEELISLLRRNGDLEEAAEAREKMAAQAPLTTKLWIEWIQDERSAGAERTRMEELFERAVFDANSLEIWMELVQWACGIDPKFAREKFEEAVSAIGLRVDVGAMIWQSYLCFEEALLGGDTTNEKQLKTVKSLYKRALRIPNVDLADTWKSYLEFAGEDVDEEIKAAHEASTNAMKEFSKYELKLAETDDSIDAFYEYLNFEKEKDDPGRIQSFYDRMLDRHPDDENIWFDYGQWCETKLKIHSITCRVYKRAVRHCPYSCALWQQTLLALERAGTPATEIDEMWVRARETISSAEDGRALYRSYLYLLRRRADATDRDFKKMAEIFEEGATSLAEWFGTHDWDQQAGYRRNWAYFAYTKLNDSKKGRQIWDDILASGGGRFADKWLEAVKLERQFGTTEGARKLLYKALNSVSDHPTLVYEYFIQFEREEGTLEQLDKALEKVNAQAAHRASRTQSQKQKEESTPPKAHSKEKHGAPKSGAPNATHRKRPAADAEEKPPAKKQVTANPETGPAPVQRTPSKDKDGFIMPMLPVKKELSVQTVTPTSSTSNSTDQPAESSATSAGDQKYTVFVSNLDFKTTPEEVKEVLEGVVEVRLVYRGMSKLTKGYGFVDLNSEENFRKALASDRLPLKGRPMLISVNDPQKRVGFKYSTGLEKTKLFVRNVHYDCTEEQLKEAFSAYGAVKAVRIVTHPSGKPKGVAYVEFEDEEGARKALDAPEVILLERKLHVALSNPPRKPDKTEPSPSTSNFTPSAPTDRKAALSMVPRGVKTASARATNGVNGGPKKAMSNDEFRKLLGN
ncbi:hypothetical protein Y032_0321g2416 [Ancylostoma ceylanicum]|uniref:RRM domain-containing protein n=1 Tax=Ancylostoma ceylanicum TaxID=53326 RepID=A0A016S0Q3_9BILA|nr:hypothetical protein Y032_0321g2416 [Ancylostoma ceylanicum]